MKKATLIFAIAVLLGSVLASCRTHERCPAYGKVSAPKTEKPC